MQGENEYLAVLNYLYEKSLVLHDPALFNKVLYFFYLDSIAHIDYTLSLYCYHYQSPKNILGAEYMRWRVDEENKGDRALFPGFITWLEKYYPDRFSLLPSLWQMIYDPEDSACYRSFRIVLDPDTRNQIPADILYAIIDEFFEQDFLKSLYDDAILSEFFRQYVATQSSV